jgi:gluconate 2-dehydrogenase gamma chain
MAGFLAKPRFQKHGTLSQFSTPMNHASHPRRAFLADSTRTFAASWLGLRLPPLSSLAAGCAREDAGDVETLTHLSAAEARTMREFAARIIPSDDGTPGANEAGVVHFVDRAVGMTFFAEAVPVVRAGLADLDIRAKRVGGRNVFASLTTAQQNELMREIEHSPFFAIARSLVVIGAFADPSYGGNRGGAGWKMLAIEHGTTYAPPFGWYDSELHPDAA